MEREEKMERESTTMRGGVSRRQRQGQRQRERAEACGHRSRAVMSERCHRSREVIGGVP
jgi:hypothetical protein